MKTRVEVYDKDNRLIAMFEKDIMPVSVMATKMITATIQDAVIEGGHALIKGVV